MVLGMSLMGIGFANASLLPAMPLIGIASIFSVM